MIDQAQWIEFFPFSSPRPEQVSTIDFVLNSFYTDQKETVVISLGTGIGKSAIAMCVANYMNAHPLPVQASDEDGFESGAYVLTTQKILQEQYMRDFAGPPTALVTVKSANNFDCTGRPGTTCADSRRVYKLLKDRFPRAPQDHCRMHCPYTAAKAAFMNTPVGITNYSFMLASTMYTHQFKPRRLLVCDEAHVVEHELGKFVELRITEKFSTDVLKLKFPKTDDVSKSFKWLSSKYEPALSKYINKLCNDIAAETNDGSAVRLSKRLETLDKHLCKIHRLQKTFDPNNWIVNVSTENGRSAWEYKPIDVAPWSGEMLLHLGQKKLLMSATILDYDYYCKTVGIDGTKTAFLTMDSPFKPENKPIIYAPAGKMSFDDIDRSLPKMVSLLADILQSHPEEKGLVHTSNFKIVKYLAQHLPKELASRMLFQLEGVDRNQLLEQHVANSGTPTVLVSPSMLEGVDLRDDLSRFQVFCKVPFPNLADRVIKKRKQNNPMSYRYMTALSMVQGVGRSVRSETDHATTYIADACFESFYRDNFELFPKSFRDSIQRL